MMSTTTTGFTTNEWSTPGTLALAQHRLSPFKHRDTNDTVIYRVYSSHGTVFRTPSCGPLRHVSSGQAAEQRETYLDEAQYHHEADHTLDILCEELERLVEDAGIDDADIELSQGVLTLKLGSLGTYVINKQTPNKQLWLSSPIRYECIE